MRNILDFTNVEARSFLLKGDSYVNFDLPKYFTFDDLIKKISNKIDNKELSDFYATTKPNHPKTFDEVNYVLLNNKDGRYAWRPFEIIHPTIYVYLVHRITEINNWQTILNRFRCFKEHTVISCMSLPIESENSDSDKASQVINWWNEVEQRSLECALEYEYVYHTDISDCYPSIYTHSVVWALHTKEVAKREIRNNSLLGNIIDGCLQSMSYGQTNGIPQGSVLMDLLAELVLGYVDELVTERMSQIDVCEYKIIRYRDDYRVFVNSPEIAERILKILTEVLIGLGLKLNSSKTVLSVNAIESSIKPDKSHWIQYGSELGSLLVFVKRLHSFSGQFPNSGTLVKMLQRFYKKIENLDSLDDYINPVVMISYLADIAYRNPRTYPIAIAVISKLILFIKQEDRQALIDKIRKKFSRIPNTGHLDLWLQRMTIKIYPGILYPEKLCRRVFDSNIKIWNSDWLCKDMQDLIQSTPLVDFGVINSFGDFISSQEVALFRQLQDS